MRYHDRFLSAVKYLSRRRTASFPAGKALVAGLIMEWRQRHMALAVLLEAVEQVEQEWPVLWEAVVVGWSVATLVEELRSLQAA